MFQSFNTVLNCWAQSRIKGAARRATAILKHMEQRYASSSSGIPPDTASYTTVINAWARSRERDASVRAEEVLQRAEEAFASGNDLAQPNALTYNSMINCYAKSNDPDASQKSLAILDLMKEKFQLEGFEDCRPDVVTYTSVIDTLARTRIAEAADIAENLMEELENLHESNPGDRRRQPNIRTYTSVCINRFWRAHEYML